MDITSDYGSLIAGSSPVRAAMKIHPWPKWYGNYTRYPKRYAGWHFKIWIGSCSHGTAWQINVETSRFNYYLVFREKAEKLPKEQ